MTTLPAVVHPVLGSPVFSTTEDQFGGGADPVVMEFSAVTVRPDGWTLSATIGDAKDGGTYAGLDNASSPGLALTVTSKSWTTGGVETTASRTVYATTVLRKPYNQQTSLEETEDGSDLDVILTLSDYIYADEAVTCAVAADFYTDDGTGGSSLGNDAQTPSVTNSSTFAYEEPQAVWLQHDLQHVKASSFSPKLFVFHRHAKSGQPVRAVKFSATDGTTTVTAFATSLSSEQYSASSLYSNYYTASLDFSTLTQGALITIDAVIYPWIGDAFTISTDAETYPSPNLCVMKVLNDRTGGYGTVYAYVDGTGSGGSEDVSETPATAATTPYANIRDAAAAIQTYNGANFSRSNVSGGIIRITASTTITGLGADTLDSLTDGDVPLVIEGVNQSTSVYTNAATSINNDINNLLKFSNLTIQKNGASIIALDGAATVANLLAFENVIFDANSQSTYLAWTYRIGRGYFINCSGDWFGQGGKFATEVQGTALALGCTFIPEYTFNAVACDATLTANGHHIGNVSLAAPKGGVRAFNFISSSNTSNTCVLVNATAFGNRGVCIVNNILEKFHASGSPTALSASADSDVVAIANLNIVANTIVGQRTNAYYQDTGSTTISKTGLMKHNIHYERNTKSDVFGTNANLIGNWPIRHGVGGGYELLIQGDSGAATDVGPDTWIGDRLGPGTVLNSTADFTTDASATGTGAGGGDYSLGGSTTAPQIPSGETIFAKDLFGTVIPTDGSAYAGAVQ